MRCSALLSEGPRYGLRLREEFEDRIGKARPLNVPPAVLAFHLIEGGWLLVVAVLLLAATAWFVRHRAA
jgi:hypothetical protein